MGITKEKSTHLGLTFFSLSPFKRILFTANPASHYTVDIVTQAVILDQSLNTFLEMFLI